MKKEEFPSEKDLDQDPKEETAAKAETAPDQGEDAAKPDQSKSDQPKAEETAKLQAEIAKLQQEKEELENKYLLSEAENQNAQKRYNKERAQIIKYESQNLAKEILPALDNLERALAVEVDDDASKQLKKGVQMTLDALVKGLKDQGISEIAAENAQFDPTLHQAVQMVPADDEHPKDHVVQVLQKGYLYKDRTLRPAMVVVAQ
ncbi:nucleotide exchange factor GrpE [Lactobacillus corticis]|uniref:Protein GrpE n=1 Tax=Lactobacillus corticis TaxID=2201249 RepID=A0A916QKH5_9LACO|nr:nucleotide exchange factor GrpE [Lactobacillus corticis]GFZ27190.1 heat shock protein GrpE [Lactobacillus corticis]